MPSTALTCYSSRRVRESNTTEPGGPVHDGFEDRDPTFVKTGRTFANTP